MLFAETKSLFYDPAADTLFLKSVLDACVLKKPIILHNYETQSNG